jgi:hypothetical protein
MSENSGFVEQALGVVSRVELERGHWVVFLDVSFWNKDSEDQLIKIVRRRITTYPTQARAKLAASFMVRAAARNQPHPPTGY